MFQIQDYSLAPYYKEDSCRCIGVLQHLQRLLSNDATLADVEQIVQNLQQEFGSQARLEQVIQSLVGRFLESQVTLRKTRDKNRHPR